MSPQARREYLAIQPRYLQAVIGILRQHPQDGVTATFEATRLPDMGTGPITARSGPLRGDARTRRCATDPYRSCDGVADSGVAACGDAVENQAVAVGSVL